MLIDVTPGAKVVWGIGNHAAGTYDLHPGVLVRQEVSTPDAPKYDERGREGTVDFIMIQRTSLEGHTFLEPHRILDRWVDDRFTPEAITGLDATEDGEVLTVPALMQAYGKQRADYFRGEPVTAGEPEAEPVKAAARGKSKAKADDLPF